jgi:hypothetical protein
MAIVFELCLNFGSDSQAAYEFCKNIEKSNHIFHIGKYTIKLHEPLLVEQSYGRSPYIEVSLVPAGVGAGVALDSHHGYEHFRLNSSEISQLGHQLYDLIVNVPGYLVALVDWDADIRIDIEELCETFEEEIAEGSMTGLVVAKSILSFIPKSTHFVPFDTTHDWIPYQGTRGLQGR